MPTHTYMSPEPPARGVFAVSAQRTRIASLEGGSALSNATPRFVMRIAEIGLVAFTGGAGVWCFYEAVRLLTS